MELLAARRKQVSKTKNLALSSFRHRKFNMPIFLLNSGLMLGFVYTVRSRVYAKSSLRQLICIGRAAPLNRSQPQRSREAVEAHL
jgi:hypothetical protein